MRDLTVKQFMEAKKGMEANLAAAIQKEVDEFEKATGMTPESIDVQMVHVTFIGGQARHQVGRAVARTVPF